MDEAVKKIIRWHVQVWAKDAASHPAPTAHSLAEAMRAMELTATQLAAIAEVSPDSVRSASDGRRDRNDSGPIGDRAVAMRCYLMDVVEQLERNTSADPGPCWYWPDRDRDHYLDQTGTSTGAHEEVDAAAPERSRTVERKPKPYELKLLDRYRDECARNHLAQHERLQDNEFIHLIRQWLEDWVLAAVDEDDDRPELGMNVRIAVADALRERI